MTICYSYSCSRLVQFSPLAACWGAFIKIHSYFSRNGLCGTVTRLSNARRNKETKNPSNSVVVIAHNYSVIETVFTYFWKEKCWFSLLSFITTLLR